MWGNEPPTSYEIPSLCGVNLVEGHLVHSCARLCWLEVNAHLRVGPVFAGVAVAVPGGGPGTPCAFLRTVVLA